MTHTPTAAPPPAAAPPTTPLPPPPTAPTAPAIVRPDPLKQLFRRVASYLADSPSRLRVMGVLSVAACVVFAVVAGVTLLTQSSDLASAKGHAAQVVRLESIRTSLLTADANATNAFLVGGLESSAVSTAYDTSIASASASIADAAAHEGGDADVLHQVNGVLSRYTGLVAEAQANNRQGFPVGAAYLRQATALLRNEALPQLDYLVRFEQARVTDAFAASDGLSALLGAALVLALGLLVLTQVWLFVHSRRTFNVGLLVATIAVAVSGLIGLKTMSFATHRAESVQHGDYAAVTAIADARVKAFDAKSDESLTLIARGSGQAYETSFESLTAAAANSLLGLANHVDASAAELRATDALRSYHAVHTTIRADDDAGNWDQAVRLATEQSGAGSANEVFASFDLASQEALKARSNQVHSDLSGVTTPLLAAAAISVVAGLIAAIAAGIGVSRRLGEYR
jgi:hypothetical protein